MQFIFHISKCSLPHGNNQKSSVLNNAPTTSHHYRHLTRCFPPVAPRLCGRFPREAGLYYEPPEEPNQLETKGNTINVTCGDPRRITGQIRCRAPGWSTPDVCRPTQLDGGRPPRTAGERPHVCSASQRSSGVKLYAHGRFYLPSSTPMGKSNQDANAACEEKLMQSLDK